MRDGELVGNKSSWLVLQSSLQPTSFPPPPTPAHAGLAGPLSACRAPGRKVCALPAHQLESVAAQGIEISGGCNCKEVWTSEFLKLGVEAMPLPSPAPPQREDFSPKHYRIKSCRALLEDKAWGML